MSNQKPGAVVDVKAGESVVLDCPVDSAEISLTLHAKQSQRQVIVIKLEPKSGQRARMRIEAGKQVRIGKPQPVSEPA